MATKSYKIVYIPAELSEPLQAWQLEGTQEKLVESLLDRLKAHFSANSPQKTAAQLARQKAELQRNLPAGTAVDDRMLQVATSMQMVENIALLANAPEHGFVGVNMYVDDEGSIKQLPLNHRASEISACAGKPMEVRGDAFLSRVLDDGDDFDRLDLTTSEVSSTAKWVRDAAAQNRRKAAESRPEQLKEQLLQRTAAPGAASAGGRQRQQGKLPPPPPLRPADAAKAAGNKAFAAGRFEEALQQYGAALEADAQLVAARNNRALCLLKLDRFAEAEADAAEVLRQQPDNVKALLRRANAREALGRSEEAAADYQAVLQREPSNREALAKLPATPQPGLP